MSSRGEDPGTDAASPRHPRVLHLEHTGVRGGAEYALLRMLRAGAPWSPLVMLAPTGKADLGVWEALPSDVPQRIVGVRQPAGVSTGGGRLQLAATARLVPTVPTSGEPAGAELVVEVDEPLLGVAPGQTAVLYSGTRVLGQCTIARTVSAVPATAS